MYGTKFVFGVSNLGVAVCCLLTPVLATVSVWCVLSIRLLQVTPPPGPGSHLSVFRARLRPSPSPPSTPWSASGSRRMNGQPSSHLLIWVFHSVITNPLCGLIISSLGWEAVFYVTGAISAGWCLVWLLLVTDSPEQSKVISDQERKYIIDNREYNSSSDEDDIPLIPLLV